MNSFLPFIVIGLTTGSIYGLAGIGLVLTYKTSGIFNFAHGSIAALVGYAFYDLREKQGLPWPLAMAICLLVLAPLIGLVLEQIARRVADAPVVLKVVATVAVLVSLQQVIILRYTAAQMSAKPFLPRDTVRILDVNVGYDQLIIMAISLVGMIALTLLFVKTRLGRTMRAVVDRPNLLALMGTSPTRVRRVAWLIGTMFAGLSGVLLVPIIGLEPTALTMLVVQAFGAAAVGMFSSFPLTYAGGLGIGVLGALTTKYVSKHPDLGGLPPSLPFLILFIVLVVAPRRKLLALTNEQRPRVTEPRKIPLWARIAGTVLIGLIVIRIPDMVGPKQPLYTAWFAYAIIFLSLTLLMRTSNMVSLAQLSFAACGSVFSAKLHVDGNWPWALAVLFSALVTVPVGALLAVPAIRRSGIYLALATYGFAVLVERLALPSKLMYGGNFGAIPAPRPGWADSDRAYFYLVVVIAVLSMLAVALLLRSRLGRLLRAMADSPTALTTYGTSVTRLKVIVFCVAAFLAGLGGALLGPVTELAAPEDFVAFESLALVVLLSIVHGAEIGSALAAAFAHIVFPIYLDDWFGHTAKDYFPLLIGLAALGAARRFNKEDHAGPGKLRKAIGSWTRRSPAPAAAGASAGAEAA